MANLFEKIRDAWDVLKGLQQVTKMPQSGTRPIRYGSSADAPDEDISVLSGSFQFYKNWTHLEPDRMSVYSDLDEMLTYVLASSALEAYIEDATQPDFKNGLIVTPTSQNPQVIEEIYKFFEMIELEDRIVGDMWNLAKYGDYFNLLLVDEDKGVFDAAPLEPRIVWRHEDSRRVLTGFSIGDASENTDDAQKEQPKYKPWDIVHYRMRSKRVSDPYGTPFFFNVRMVYKVLKLMEEQMVIYRMNMHPDRLVFKVFTGNAGPEDKRRQIRMWRREMERMVTLDRSTGSFRAEYAPWQINQNIYWPVTTGDNNSGVEKFAGSANAGDCFTYDTKVSLLDGREVPIGEVVPGDWVYSCDPGTGKVSSGKVLRSWKARENAPLVRVTIDNGESIRCTPDHRFMLRTGEYREAQYLQSGDSLMPLYREISSKTDRGRITGYEKVWNNADGQWVFTHRMVCESVGKECPMGHVRHHVDLNKRNNSPDNLQILHNRAHTDLHVRLNSSPEKRALLRRLHKEGKCGFSQPGVSDKIWNGPNGKANRKAQAGRMAAYNRSEHHRKRMRDLHAKGDSGFSNPETLKKAHEVLARTPTSLKTLEYLCDEERQSKRVEKSKEGLHNKWHVGRRLFLEGCSFCAIEIKENARYGRHLTKKQMNREKDERKLHKRHVTGKLSRTCSLCYSLVEFAEAATGERAPDDCYAKIGRPRNHKVVSVEKLVEREDVYDIAVEGIHNFALSSGIFVHNCFDVAYMRDLFFAGVRVPKAYMGFEDSQGYRGTDTLSAQSIKFARGVKRIQRHYLRGLSRLVMIHLACKGIDARKPMNEFKLETSPTSYLDEAHKAELYAKRYEALSFMLDIGGKMRDQLDINASVWAQYVLKEFGGFDSNMIAQLTAPDTSAAPEMNYTPGDTALSFEACESEEQKIREMIGNDKKLTEAVQTARRVDAEVTVQSSSRDQIGARNDLASLKMGEKPPPNKEIYERVQEHNETEKRRLMETQRASKLSRQMKLKQLAERAQDEFSD